MARTPGLSEWDAEPVSSTWVGSDESALRWIEQVSATSGSVTSYDVRGLPESILVLHPMFERVDGGPIQWRHFVSGDSPGDDASSPAFVGSIPEGYRLLPWREYAIRRGLDVLEVDRWPFALRSGGVAEDERVYTPAEGTIDVASTWNALMKVLADFSADGSTTGCTAYYFITRVLGILPDGRAPVFRGLLGDVEQLTRWLGTTPQNLWPDDHAWVLRTDYDAWYTKISGSSELIRAIADDPNLETCPVQEL